jgi:hypothetical protein
MTIKDWGAYASLKPPAGHHLPNVVTWVFAQEYPWDALLLRPEVAGEDVAQIPSDVAVRLFGQTSVTPPSHLSQLGLDFVCRSTWLITPTSWIQGEEPSFTAKLNGELWQATHSIAKPSKPPRRQDDGNGNGITPANATGKITVSYVPFSGASDKNRGDRNAKYKKKNPAEDSDPISHVFSLEQLALEPITETGTSNGAVLTFARPDFHYFAADGSFAITTKSNRFYATGTGFTQQDNDLHAMVPVSGPGKDLPGLVLRFKVLDLEKEYDLVLKHWLAAGQGAVAVSVCVNPPLDSKGNPDLTHPQAVRYVSETQGEGGNNNVTAIALRDLSFGTPDYHDYLQLGLNIIYLTLSAEAAPQEYVLRALAIG